MRMAATPARLLTAAVAVVLLAGCSPDMEPPRRDGPGVTEPTFRGLQAYPYSSPVPPLSPTSADGKYRRIVTIAQAGGKPVACRRCAPYRLDAGSTLLVLERGRFFLLFRPVTAGDVCPGCKPAGSFRASGHFVVNGGRIELFNDPNCEEVRGTYSWKLNGRALTFETIEDPCFGGIRGTFLAAFPWQSR